MKQVWSISGLIALFAVAPIFSAESTPTDQPIIPIPPKPPAVDVVTITNLPIFGASEPNTESASTPAPVIALPAPAVPRGRTIRVIPPSATATRSARSRPEVTQLAWDEANKEVTLAPGEPKAEFQFSVTNVSEEEVIITAVRTSCGCTVPKLPQMPWKLAPGAKGSFDVTVDVRGKQGSITKTVTVTSSAGISYLTVKTNIPEDSGGGRGRNMMIALADRQAIFKNDCASCHVQPAIGKMGAELYTASCGICHEAEHRASMVPDLKALNKETPLEYWQLWVRHGKAGTLMPGFAQSEGGPLTEAQIQSLTKYLTTEFPAAISAAKADHSHP